MTTYYAQPYDISATGFYFDDATGYLAKIEAITNDYGDRVEEFEIQFIDGANLDSALFNALNINQANVIAFMEKLDVWEDWNKKDIIISVGELGNNFDISNDDPDDIDIDLYTEMTLLDLAHAFVDEGLFGEIPESIANYLDFDLIARDLGHDYTETTIAGVNYVYRCV